MTIPKCKFYKQCGGCNLQHIDYEKQLENKKRALSSLIGYEDIRVISLEPYNYRNRMDFVFSPGGLGLRKKGDWRIIIDVDKCEIADPKINTLLKEIKDFGFFDPFDVKKHTGTYRYAVIRTPGKTTSISFVLNSKSSRLKDAVDKIKEFSKKTTANNILVTYVEDEKDQSISSDYFIVKGREMLSETILGKTLQYSAQGFFQNNSAMANEMHKYVRKLLEDKDYSKHHLLDLYGGVGAFGIINADKFSSVMIVESVTECINAANKNIKKNLITNATATIMDAKNIKKLKLESPLIVITDPPRSGMHPSTIMQLNSLNPDKIIYISCNPSQLSKELPRFFGYKIKSVAMFDMFAQTTHFEAVVELIRDSLSI